MVVANRTWPTASRWLTTLVAIALLGGCATYQAAFMHGYTQADYEGLWWPVDPRRPDIEPSGIARLEIEMGLDPVINNIVATDGYPDYIYVGDDERTELAYLDADRVYVLERGFFDVASTMLVTLPIAEARIDAAGKRPGDARRLLPDRAPRPAPRFSTAGYRAGPARPLTVSTRGQSREPSRAAVPGPGQFGRYHALVIGNRDYANLPRLRTPLNDARAIARMLKDSYGFRVLVLENATRHAMFNALANYRRALTPEDNLLIYFAGHGIIDADTAIGYWLAVDAENDNPANWVSNDDIAAQLKAMRARHVLVVADSCYSGTLTRSFSREFSTRGGTEEWIERVAAKRSRTVLTSGSLEPVADGGGDGHSVFARAFLSVLADNRAVTDMDTLFIPISRKVVANANQTPLYADIRLADHDDGDFIFAPR